MGRFKGRFNRQKKEAGNLKVGQWKLPKLRNRKDRFKRPGRCDQEDQHMQCGSPRRRGEKGQREYFKK